MREKSSEKNNITKRIINITIIVSLCFVLYIFLDFTYSLATNKEPDIVLTANNQGIIITEETGLGDNLWYPGYSESGIIRIYNQSDSDRVVLVEIGVVVDLLELNNNYSEDVVYNSFLENMKLTIKKEKVLLFDDTLLHENLKSLLDGYELFNQYTIIKGDYIDLEYTLTMSEEAGNELESIKAEISFFINVE